MASDDSSIKMYKNLLWLYLGSTIIAVPMIVTILYLYLLPFQIVKSTQLWRDPRPRAFVQLLLTTALSFFVAGALNLLYYAERLPQNPGSESPVTLSLDVWIVIIFFATTSRQISFPILYLLMVNVLQSRWYAFVKHSTGHKHERRTKESKPQLPEFLGWRGKEKASFFVAGLMLLLPIISNVCLAVGLKQVSQSGIAVLLSIDRVATALDGVRGGLVAFAVLDIGISSFFLSRRLKASDYGDTITSIMLHAVTPLLLPLALENVIAALFRTMALSEKTLAAVDFSNWVVTNVIIVICMITFCALYSTPLRWLLTTPDEENIHPTHNDYTYETTHELSTFSSRQ
ncbi:SubName: Full=Uncharacterized protein {ECO:0000313/EMBL:CCA69490.1} [Serendipita indica DSM 11827]|nr:SubName: Full=Uncharacterized protein {ECO:0000313/EMBL:CCA69490.1} [Serendipita indica DSM 11827]